jgi:MATE family multidrug resistance protein
MNAGSQGAAPWRKEASALVRLALPLIAGNLAWSAIATTDLLLLGRAGPDAVAAGALAINIYNAVLVAGLGLVTAAAPLIAAERGRRRHAVREVRRTVRQTIWAAALFCLPAWTLLGNGRAILALFHQDPLLSNGATALLHGLAPALLPYLVFATLRNFISSLERLAWGVAVMAGAVPFNLLAGWSLIFGHLGLPALGLFGAGLASSLTALFMAAAMVAVVLIDRRFRRYRLFGRFWRADWGRFRDIWRVGSPIAVTLALEVTVFNAAAFLMGLIDRVSLAAHAIAIQIAACSFMVPMGIGQAATIRVGLAHGAGDRAQVARAGWTALALGTLYAAIGAALLAGVPGVFIGIFIDTGDPANAAVAGLASSFLLVAAYFQLFDAVQVVGAGALRGIEDTRVPMIFAGLGYWVIGIGAGGLLAFRYGFRGEGIWIGLAAGLGTVALLVLLRWIGKSRPPATRKAGPSLTSVA